MRSTTMDGENQNQAEEAPKGKGPAVKDSIKRLKEKFVPGVKYTLLVSAAISFALLVVGCVNVHNCPVNKNIPLFLIATGAIGLVSKFVSYVRNRISKHMQVAYLESALYSVEGIFFFLGTYWVYKVFKPNFDNPSRLDYCNKTAYLFGFVYLTIYYVIVATMIFGCCCFLCCIMFVAATDDKKGQDVENQGGNTEVTESLTKKEEGGEAKP